MRSPCISPREHALAPRLSRAILETSEELAKRKRFGHVALEYAAPLTRSAHVAALEARRANDRKAA